MTKAKKFISEQSALVAFVALLLLSIILRGGTFLSLNNIINILRNNSIVGIIALGMTMIIITGGIDLSVGSMLVIGGMVTLLVINATGSILLGITTALVVGVLMGLFSGVLVAKAKIPAFIVTLGTMRIYRSLAQHFLNGGGLLVKGDSMNSYIAISNTNLFGWLPLPIIYWLVLALMVHLFMKYTPTGRHIYAVGSNEKATMLSSINVNRVKIITYVIASVLVCIAAVVETSRLGSINSASSGTNYEMDAIAAVVIGGTSMSGGRGKIFNTVLGTLTLGIINNMLNLMGVPPFLVGVVKGAIIIGAVLLQKGLDKENA